MAASDGKKYNNVPEENRVDPQLNITGPTLESLKYNIMDDDLADMFSNLLVSDMDSTTQGLCTPSFVKVIEQMTPNDAKTFKSIYDKNEHNEALPLLRIAFTMKDNPKKTIKRDAVPKYYSNLDIDGMDHFSISKSIQNLHRLGLIELIEELRYYVDNSIYDKIIMSEKVVSFANHISNIMGYVYEAKVDSKGIIQLNDFSHDFAKVCLRLK